MSARHFSRRSDCGQQGALACPVHFLPGNQGGSWRCHESRSFLNAPKVIRDACSLSGGHPEGLVDAAEVMVHEVQGHVRRVSRRMLIRMVRFCRSTELVETCRGPGLGCDAQSATADILCGTAAGLGFRTRVVELYEHRVVNLTTGHALYGGRVGRVPVRSQPEPAKDPQREIEQKLPRGVHVSRPC